MDRNEAARGGSFGTFEIDCRGWGRWYWTGLAVNLRRSRVNVVGRRRAVVRLVLRLASICAQPPAPWAATSLRTSSTVSTFPLGSVAESNSDQMSSSTALARPTNSALSRKTRSTSRPVRKLRNLSFQSIHGPPSAWLSEFVGGERACLPVVTIRRLAPELGCRKGAEGGPLAWRRLEARSSAGT